MGDRVVMSVSARTKRLEGCDVRTTGLCQGFAWSLVRSAATVLAGERPAALFLFRPASCPQWSEELLPELEEVVGSFREALARRGIALAVVGSIGRQVAILLWRYNLVAQLLRLPNTRTYLASRGLDVRDARHLMADLARRLGAYYAARRDGAHDAPFPHEVGIALGYPLGDVIGFIDGGCEICRGRWRCYGDANGARRRFAELDRIEGSYVERFRTGTPLGELVRA